MAKSISDLVDNQAEATLIATLLLHPEYLYQVETMKAKYFYNVENGCFYWAIKDLQDTDGVHNIDALNLTRKLNENSAVKRTINKYNVPDIQEYINMSRIVARDSVDEYKKLVKDVMTLAFRRQLYSNAIQIQNMCMDDNVDLNGLDKNATERINRLSEEFILPDKIDMYADKIDDLWKEIKDRQQGGRYTLIPSKFPSLKEYFYYEPGEMVLLAARMKQGKSTFFLNECVHKLKAGVPVLYLDSEMSSRNFTQRLLAHLTGINVKQIKEGTYNPELEPLIQEQINWIKKQKFVHQYLPETSNEEIFTICKILKARMGLKFVIYDYIKSNVANSAEQYNMLGERTDFLKNKIAGELDVAVLAGAQLNRNGEIADSDKLERYCSTSMIWSQKDPEERSRDGEECGNYKLKVKLNRNGEQMDADDYIDMYLDGNKMLIEEAVRHEEPETPFVVDEKE